MASSTKKPTREREPLALTDADCPTADDHDDWRSVQERKKRMPAANVLSTPSKEEERMKAIAPITMPMKQASRERIMKARVASQYAVGEEMKRHDKYVPDSKNNEFDTHNLKCGVIV